MHLFWYELRTGVSLVVSGNPELWRIVAYTLLLTATATGTALVLGLPLGLWLGLGRSRIRRPLRFAANAGLALPPVLVAATLFVFSTRQAPLASLDLIWTRRGVWVAQTILALPYVVALVGAATDAIHPGLLAQARRLGAGPLAQGRLALSEARRGVITATIAAAGSCLSEVAIVAVLGGNIYGYDQTLASATLYQVNGGSYPNAVGLALVLGALILLLMGALGLLQQSSDGLGLRWVGRVLRSPG